MMVYVRCKYMTKLYFGCFATTCLSHFRKERASYNKSCKTRSGSRSAKTFLHLGKWKQGTSKELLQANKSVLCIVHTARVSSGWAEEDVRTAECNGWGSAVLTWLRSFQLAQHAGRASRHLLGKEAGLPHICLQMLCGLENEWTWITYDHKASPSKLPSLNLLKIIPSALSCSTPFPTLSVLFHFRKILQ